MCLFASTRSKLASSSRALAIAAFHAHNIERTTPLPIPVRNRIGAPCRGGGRGGGRGDGRADYGQPDGRRLQQPESRRHYHSHPVDSEDQSVPDKEELELQQHSDSDITFLDQ